MTETLSLFDQPRARTTDPRTSKLAAVRMAPAAPALEARILEALTFRCLTDDGICLALDIDPRRWPSCKTARSRLKKSGKVAWTGETRAGQRVWGLPVNIRDAQMVRVAGDRL